jgi:hypothetical protein
MIEPKEIKITNLMEFYPGFNGLFGKSPHEDMSQRRVVAFQMTLDSMATDKDLNAQQGLQYLQDRLEIQLKIEELIIKTRQAEHIKLALYLPLVWPGALVVISVVALFLHR